MYRSVNLGFTLERQKEVGAREKTRMQTKINVVASLQLHQHGITNCRKGRGGV
jgi:hypothetical protein